MTVAAFREDRTSALQLHATLEAFLRAAVLRNAQVIRCNANHVTVLIEHLTGRDARVDLDAQRFGLLAQPLDQMSQPDHIVTVIVHWHACVWR